MKKFFSLLCAILLVVSASAAPVAQKAQLVKKAPVAVEQMQKVQFEKAQSVKTISLENAQLSNQLSAAPAVKVINQKAAMQPKQMVAKHLDKAQRVQLHQQATNVARAPKRVAQSEELLITESEVDDTYADGEYDLYLLTSIGGETRQICIYLYNSSLEGSYDINNYNIDPYSCVIGPNYDPYYEMSACSVTITSLGDDQYSCECSFTIETGSYTFSTTLSYTAHVPQVYEITASDFSMVDYGTDMYMTALDAAGNNFFFDVLYTGSFEFGKTYTLTDMDPDYSWYKLASGGGNEYTEASITVTKDQDGLLHVVAAVVLDNGDSYEITYDEKAFVPTGVQITVDGTNLEGQYLSYYGFYLYTATWGDYTVQLAFDAEEEKASYTNEEFLANYGLIYETEGDEEIYFEKLASDNITITNTETTKTLAGSIYAKNGDEYVLNLVYEKPAPVSRNVFVTDATIFTKALAAGYWTIGGKNAAKDMDINLYFISKNVEGTFTAENMDAYSTWLDDSSTGTKITYQNLSAANINSAIVGDSLILEGTMTLADNNGGEANVTLHVSTPYSTETWGEWADFAPFGLNTGKFVFSAMFNNPTTQVNLPVQVREDADGNKQFKVSNWGKGIFSSTGQDLIINMDKDGFLTSVPVNLGDLIGYGDIYAEGIDSIDAKFDAENGIFPLAMSYTIPDFYGIEVGNAIETLTMDKPILERDTVEVTADMKLLAEPAKGIIKVSAELNDTTYILEVVGADTVGTFSLADGTLSQQYYYGIVSAAGRSDFAEGEVTIAKNETGLKLNGLMIGVDEKAYVLDWTYTPITERDTVYVNSNTLDAFYQESINGYVYQSSNTDYELIQFVTKSSEKLGTFAVADLQYGYSYLLVHKTDQTAVLFQDGEFTVSEDEEGFKLIGTLIGEDEKAYVFNLVQPVGVLEKDTDAPFDATFAWKEMDASIDDGVISIFVQKGTDLALELVLFTDPAATEIPEGVYTISDSQEAGTALQSTGYGEQGPAACYAATLVVQQSKLYLDDMWFIVEGTVTLSYDEYGKLKVVVDGKNSYGQPVTAVVQYEKLEPKSTVEINAEFSVYEGYVEQYGIMNFYGGNEEGYEFDLYAYATTHIGDFVDAVDFGDCEIATPDGTVGVIDAYEFVVATEDGKHITLTAKVLGTDTIQYNITATGFYGALAYDTNEDYEGDFNIVDLTIGQTGQYITIKGINEVGDSINFAFVGELVDNAIPAGEYTEVMVSTGLNAKNNPTTSFVWNAENYLWFVQSGTLTVNELGAMRFAGLNSFDKNVVINFIAPVPPVVTDYYLVGWINNAAYGIEGDIDNFGDYHFVDGKVTATFDELSYVQVKDNNKQIYGSVAYVAPVERGTATLLATGKEKVAINGGIEMEYTLTVNEDGTLTLDYAPVTTGLNDINAAIKTNKVVRNGRLMIIKNTKVYSVLGQQIQ